MCKHIACAPEPAEEQHHFQTWCFKTVSFRASSVRKSSLIHCCVPRTDAAPWCSPPSVCCRTVPSGLWQHAEVSTRLTSLVYSATDFVQASVNKWTSKIPPPGCCASQNRPVHGVKFSVPLYSGKARAPIPFGEKYAEITHDRNSSKTTSLLQIQRDVCIKRHMKKTKFLLLQVNNTLGQILLTLKNQPHYFLLALTCFLHVDA